MYQETTHRYWKEQQPEQMLHSMFFEPNLFMHMIPRDATILNAGGAGGRLERAVQGNGYKIHTFDFNENAMIADSRKYDSASHVVADTTMMPYTDNTFDAVVMLGLMGTIGKEQRTQALHEVQRVLKPNGLVYISERKRDIHLNSVYAQQAKQTGENGTIIAYTPKGEPEFLSHHFDKVEMQSYLRRSGLAPVITTENMFRSTRSGNLYTGVQVYGRKV